jgi:hypothetical protein
MLSRSFDAVIVMQIIICHSYGWQKSVLLVTDQPRPRHIMHVVVSTGLRELTRDPSLHRSAQIKVYSAHCHLPQLRLPAIGPSRHRSAQIKAYSACRRLHDARELTEILPPTRNATAQPGRSRSRRREAFLPLAKSYRMKGMPRASLQCRSHRGSIAVRIVMVRRRGEGSELNSCSYLGQCDAIQRNDRRRDSHRHRIQSGRSRRIEGSGFKPAVPSRLFSCDGAF